MTRYLSKEPFSVGGHGEQFSKNYDGIRWDNEPCPQCESRNTRASALDPALRTCRQCLNEWRVEQVTP